jgi:serine/threonine protein kinase
MGTRKRNTRKYSKTMKGGVFLGEGAQGKAYTVSSEIEKDFETIYHLLKKEISSIQSIELHAKIENSEGIIKDKDDIVDFVNYLGNVKGFIGKIFKYKYFEDSKKIFEKELDEIRNVMKYYGKHNKEFTTLIPLKYKHLEFIGITVNYKRSSQFIVFNKKCDNKFKVDILQLVEDLLESLVVLQESKIIHNDIKLDNIVRCDGKYKLIDWGNIMDMDFKKPMKGSFMTGSPVKFHLLEYSQYFIKQAIYYRTQTKEKEVFKSEIFNKVYKQIVENFDNVMKEISKMSKNEIIKKYTKSFDIYAVGITMVHSIIINKESYEKYEPLVNYMLDLENPPKSAVYALTFFKKFKHSLKG